MQAYQLVGWQQPPELRDVPTPEPGPGEVLVRVGGAGVCHSDLHIMEFPEGQLPYPLPFTLGHENAGWIEALGPGVTGWEVGAPVAVYGPWGCARCRTCRSGEENYCERAAELAAAGAGLGHDGGMAPFMSVAVRRLVPLGDLDPVQAAPLTDAGLTPYHAVRRSLPLLVPGSSAVVIGAGGLGHMAVQILSALAPSRVIAVDVSEDRLDQARRLGAEAGVRAGDTAAAEILDHTKGRGAELVLDIVGSDDTIALGASVVRAKGNLTVVGLGFGTFPWNFFGVPYEASLATTYWGSVVELMDVLALAEQGHLRAEVETFPLERVADAYDRMRRGTLSGRAVITPAG